MAGRIPQNFIDDLLARADIVEIISNRVQLRKTGSNFSALCPFHTEKTPSFTVSQPKQFYYCFGCGAHGNALSFLMNFDNMEFIDAIETLAAHVGVEVPHEANHDHDAISQDLYDLLSQASKYYQQQLRQSDTAIIYLKSRGLSGKISKRFNIGYAPSGWDNLATAIGNNQNNTAKLITSGMLLNKNNKDYDRFRDRIMFPIHDQRGRVIGFGGRILGDDTPKYLNTPETAIFHKGSELYGLYEAKQNNRDLNKIIVVEGYMDVVALAQYGIDYAVATLGTATTAKHIQKLLRHTSNIIFCFDGDKAGKTAAWRALENALPIMRDDMQIAFLFLPETEDPDSQIRKEGLIEFETRITNAVPLSEFFFKQITTTANLKTMDGRANIAQKALTFLNKIPNGVFKQLMLEKLSETVHIDVAAHGQMPDGFLGGSRSKGDPPVAPTEKTTTDNPLIIKAIKLLLHEPKLAQYIEDTQQISSINLPGTELLAQLLNLAQQQPNILTGTLLERWRNTEAEPTLAKLAAEDPMISDLKNEFIDTIQYIYKKGHEQSIQELFKKANIGEINKQEKDTLQKLIIDAKIN